MTFDDGGPGSGSLRDVVLQFNADSGSADDTIQLLAGTYTLTIQNPGGVHETAGLTGDLNLMQVSHRWIIEGAGSSGDNATIIDASQLQDRVFEVVTPGIQVVFQDLVIQGGLAQDNGADGAVAGHSDALGGGLLNNGGDVTLNDVVVQNNRAQGGDGAMLSAPGHNASGGGIYSSGGALTLAGATLANDQVVVGRGGDHNGTQWAGPGGSAGGGGLYATGGSLDISSSMVAGNRATGGQGGDGYHIGTTTVGGGDGGSATGAGLYVNGGSLTIASSAIATNQATGGYGGLGAGSDGAGIGGGLFNGGAATVSDSTLSGNSGDGIWNSFQATLTVTYSTLSGNSAGYVNSPGGGILNLGNLTVSNSTLSGNYATSGGGIWTNGGGLVTLTNVTLTANRANYTGGGGGGVYVLCCSPMLHNTLIAGNFRGVGTTADDVHGALDSSGDNNLIGDGTGMTGLADGVNGNQVGTAANPIDPLLGPLADNGGPTLTHALLPGSPAIDAGNNAYATDWDQRGEGYLRIVNGIIDIGAFEYQGDGSGPSTSPSSRGQEARLAELVAALPPAVSHPLIQFPALSADQVSTSTGEGPLVPPMEAASGFAVASVDPYFATVFEDRGGQTTVPWNDLELGAIV